MKLYRNLMAALLVTVCSACASDKKDNVHRVLSLAFPPCSSQDEIVINSASDLETLDSITNAGCADFQKQWREQFLDMNINFQEEAIVGLASTLGRDGTHRLKIEGPRERVLKVQIVWDYPDRPGTPIAQRAFYMVAIRKSAVDHVEFLNGKSAGISR